MTLELMKQSGKRLASLQRSCLWPRNLALDKLRGKEDMVDRSEYRVDNIQETRNEKGMEGFIIDES